MRGELTEFLRTFTYIDPTPSTDWHLRTMKAVPRQYVGSCQIWKHLLAKKGRKLVAEEDIVKY